MKSMCGLITIGFSIGFGYVIGKNLGNDIYLSYKLKREVRKADKMMKEFEEMKVSD